MRPYRAIAFTVPKDVDQFLEERCEPGPGYFVPCRELRDAYEAWSRERGDCWPSSRFFSRSLDYYGFPETRWRDGAGVQMRVRRGLQLIRF